MLSTYLGGIVERRPKSPKEIERKRGVTNKFRGSERANALREIRFRLSFTPPLPLSRSDFLSTMVLASDFFRTWQQKLSSDFASPSGQPAAWACGAAFQPGSEHHTINTGAKVHTVALSPDGTLLAVGAGETVVIYATASWTRVRRFGKLVGEVWKLAFSPDGKHLVCSSGSALRAWSVDEILQGADEEEADFGKVAKSTTSVAFREIIQLGAWSTAEIDHQRDALQSSILKVLRATATAISLKRHDLIQGYTSSYGSTPFLPSGSTLLYLPTAGNDGDAHTVEAISLPYRTSLFRLVGHTDRIMSVEASPSTPLICTASWDGTVRLWSSVDGTPSHVLRGPEHQIWCSSFSHDGALVAAGAGNRQLWIWNVESGDVVRKLEGFFPDWIRSLAWNPAGGALAAGSSGGVVRVFETDDWKSVQKWKVDERGNEFGGEFVEMQRLRWSGDGTRLLFWGTDARVTVQDVARNVKWEFEAGPDAWQDGDALISEDGTMVVCGGKDGVVRVWDI